MVYTRPSAAARAFATRAWALLTILALTVGVTTIAASPARALESPPTGNTQFYQVTGNSGSQTNGDPWTTFDGANSSFAIQIVVPQAWVTASRQVRIDLFSPSMPTNTAAGAYTVNSPAVVDETRGAGPNSTTTYSLRNPSNVVLQSTAYAPSDTDFNSWRTLTTFTPTVAGTYLLRVNSTGDDDNGFRLRVTDPTGVDDPDGVPGTGDELEIFNTQVVMQALGTVTACQNYSYFVADGTASVSVRTFDMDGSGTVVTTRADGSTSTGANSAGSVWHSDAVSVAAGQGGWWFTTVCLPSGSNAYSFDVVGNGFIIGDPPAHPALAVTKSDGRTTAYRNDTLTYTIHVTNSGTGSAFGTTLADTLPAALTFVSCSLGTASGTCSAAGQNVTATLTSKIAAGASVDLTVVATVNAGAPFAAVTNTAVIDFSDPDGHNYPTVQGSDSTTIVRTPPTAGNAAATVNPDVNAVLTPTVTAGSGAITTIRFADGTITKVVAGQGTWTLTGAGTGSGSGAFTATFDPLPAFRGVATQQSYVVTDANVLTATGTLDVTVRTGPTAGTASATVNPGVTATLNPVVTLGTGTLASVVFDTGLATKTVAGEGTWSISLVSGQPVATFAPLAAFRGAATAQAYTVTDIFGLTSSANLNVFVRTGPSAGNASATVNPGVTATLNPAVTAGTGALASVVFDNGLSTKSVAGEGTWSISLVSGQPVATFAPLAAFRGTATQQSYTVTDVNSLASSANLNVTVRTGPTAGNDSATVNPGVTATLNPAVTIGSGSLASVVFDNGLTSKTVAGEGTWSISLVSGQPVATFAPLAAFRGTATQQSYTVADVNGLTASGNLDVFVRTGPTAGNDSATVNPDVNAVLTPAVGTGTGAISTIRFVDGTISKTVAGEGTWTLTGAGTGSGSGTLTATFDPLPAFRGAATQQSYVVTDVNSLIASGTLDVFVRTGPTAGNDSATVNPGVTATLNPAATVGTGVLASVVFDNGLTIKSVAGEGTWSISLVSGQPVATFAPLAAFRGTATQQSYTVTDVNSLVASGTLDVFVRTGPTAGNDSATVNPGVTATLNPAVTVGTGVLASIVFDNGLTSKSVAGEGTWSISLVSGQPVATFAPLAAFRGTATQQSYTVTDVNGITASGNLDVFVRTGPTAGNDSTTVNPGVTATEHPVVTTGTGALVSAVFDNGLTTKTVAGEGTWSISLISGQPVATFAPEPTFRGPATTQDFVVTDANGLTATGHLDVTVRTGPAAGNDSATVNPGITATLNPVVAVGTGVLASVVFDNGLTSKPVAGEGTWSISLVSGQPVATFVPEPTFRGNATQQAFTVTDTNGLSDTGTLDVVVRTGPVAGDDSVTVNPGVAATLNPVVTPGTGALATVTFDNNSSTKAVSGEGTWTISLVAGQPEAVFTPEATFAGAPTSQYYTVADVNGLSDSGLLHVSVNGAPDAGDASKTVATGVTAVLTPTVTPGNSAITTITFADGTSSKTVAGEGTWTLSGAGTGNGSGPFTATFVPEATYSGIATTQAYLVTDANGLTAGGTLAVTVTPSATDDSASTPGGTLLTRDAANGVTPNDTGTVLLVTSVVPVGTPHGTLVLDPDGSYTFQPDQHFHGTVVYLYTTADADGQATTATLTITVTADPALVMTTAPTSVCVADTPYLSWDAALPAGFLPQGASPLTVTFVNPDGPDYVVTDLPLTGTMLWPGASATEPKQWPGWERLADGTYVETTGNFAWTRDGVQVTFEVNPEYTATLTYPPATTACADVPVELRAEDPAGDGSLSSTGATAGVFVPWASGLILVGGFFLFIARRRREDA